MKGFLIFVLCIVCNSANKPNIVIIVVDDAGRNDVSYDGSNEIPTPNIDALAYNGLILNRHYTHPSCTPSRAALLTGRYPIRYGLQGHPIIAGQNKFLPVDIEILPQRLKALGYSTHHIGKWHLGGSYRNVTPPERGYDSFFGYWHGVMGYYDHVSFGEELNSTGLDMHDNHDASWWTVGQYATTLFTDKATEIISNHDTAKPLFLMLAHLAGHSGDKNKPLEVPNVEENNERFYYIADRCRRAYAGVIHELDKAVGETVQALADKNILDNTIIILLSDNGGYPSGGGRNCASNWPHRGVKLTVFEGGVHNFALFYYSKMKYKSVVSEELIHISDVMPTVYAAAGGNISDLGDIDGINQWNTLTNGKNSTRKEILLELDEIFGSSAIIGENGRFKLINGSLLKNGYDGYFGDNGRQSSIPLYNITEVLESVTNKAIKGNLTEEKIRELRKQTKMRNCHKSGTPSPTCNVNELCLFDILNDPCETNNLVSENPSIVARLSRKLSKYRKEIVPQTTAGEDPRADPIFSDRIWIPWMDNY